MNSSAIMLIAKEAARVTGAKRVQVVASYDATTHAYQWRAWVDGKEALMPALAAELNGLELLEQVESLMTGARREFWRERKPYEPQAGMLYADVVQE